MKNILIISLTLLLSINAFSYAESMNKDDFQKKVAECEKGDIGACEIAIIDGANVNKNIPENEVANLFSTMQRFADNGDIKALGLVGFMYKNGLGVKPNIMRAINLYDKACNGGDMKSCFHLGDIYVYGKGVAVDKKKGFEYIDKACKGGNAEACEYGVINKHKK